MRLKTLVVAGILAVSSLVGAAVFAGGAYAKVSCPIGSLRGDGAQVDSLAECNIPAEQDGDAKLMPTVIKILNVVVGVVGIVTVAMIVVGGVFYATSIGDSAKTKRAMNTILYGIVGLIVSLLAFAIVNFVLGGIFGGSTATSTDGDKNKKNEGHVLMMDEDIA